MKPAGSVTNTYKYLYKPNKYAKGVDAHQPAGSIARATNTSSDNKCAINIHCGVVRLCAYKNQ